MGADADPLAVLFDGHANLDDASRDAVVALGFSAVPELLRILVDPELASSDARGLGYAPVHAAALLSAIGAREAIAPMIGLLAETEPDDILHDRILVQLPDFGADAVEPLIAAHDDLRDLDRRTELCSVLAQCGVRDDRVLNRMFAAFEHNPGLMAGAFGTYGDPAALPMLERAFDQFGIDPENPLRNMHLTDLAESIGELGELTAAHCNKLDQAAAVRQAYGDRLAADRERPASGVFATTPGPARRRERPGRNAPCWCGGGKKYKRCHLDEDERADRAESDRTQAQSRPKLSEALIEIAGEFLDVPGPASGREVLIQLVAFGWNLAVLEDFGDQEGVDEHRAKLDAMPNRAESEAIVEEFSARKRELYPDDDRLVMEVRFATGDRLLVASVPLLG